MGEGFFIALQLDKLDKFVENKEAAENPILASAYQIDAKKERSSRDLNLSRNPDRAKLFFDPHCGTGTSLVEANLRGPRF
jgi:23S rRNA G2445 N2-methylase RlmL